MTTRNSPRALPSPGAGFGANGVLPLQRETGVQLIPLQGGSSQLPLSSRNTHFNTRALSSWPKQKHLLLWEVNGGQVSWDGTGQTFLCGKTMGETPREKDSYGNGVLLHIFAVSPGFPALLVLVDVEWITTAAWWSSKPWTHFLVLSNGDTLKMWLIRESSWLWQTFSNGNGFWGLLTPRVKLLSS